MVYIFLIIKEIKNIILKMMPSGRPSGPGPSGPQPPGQGGPGKPGSGKRVQVRIDQVIKKKWKDVDKD
jgi:hypothetical protein